MLFGCLFVALIYSITNDPCISVNEQRCSLDISGTAKQEIIRECPNLSANSSDVNSRSMFAKKAETRPEDRNLKTVSGVPTTHIGFLKVHKAGSSTIQNILFRFGIRNSLTFLLPYKWQYVKYKSDIIPLYKARHYDIFACHAIFKPDFFDLLPKNAINMAIVRDPLTRMISAAYFYRDVMQKEYLMNISRETLIPDLINHADLYDREVFSRTKNSMGCDFGFPETVSRKDARMIEVYMTYLKNRFSLVLLMERFDESIVLMKRRLNWSVRDIIYMKSNSNPHPVVNLTQSEKDKFKEISFLDYEIYNTFSEIFAQTVEELGDEFQQEVKYVRTVNNFVSEFCRTTNNESSRLVVPRSEWNESFNVTYDECQLMKLSDLVFVQRLRAEQLQTKKLRLRKNQKLIDGENVP